jgi:NADH dehydrogenase/NADH:ubiquinone oxidoreductase subunit G
MTKKEHWGCTILVFTLCAIGSFGYAQKPEDTVTRVQALDDFHEVIYRIWHEAWPKKDTAMLRQLLPDVEKGISKVASAPLPGILREKKAVWEEGVKKLENAGAEYKAAVAAKDDTRLLAAAETLHSRFEALMRSIRPALRELDEFHIVLYTLYHHYVPEYDLEKIRIAVAELKEKMAALNKAELPEAHKQRAAEFQAARARLSKSVDALEASLKSGNEKVIKDAVEKMHTDYQALNRVFE